MHYVEREDPGDGPGTALREGPPSRRGTSACPQAGPGSPRPANADGTLAPAVARTPAQTTTANHQKTLWHRLPHALLRWCLLPEAPITDTDGHLGIRPSHVRWTRRPQGNGPQWLPATVRQVDAMGEDTLIYVLVEGEPVTILEREPCTARTGEEIHVAFPSEAVHLFVGGQRKMLERDITGPRALATAPVGDSGK